MGNPATNKFFAYAGVALMLAPAFAPILQWVVKRTFSWVGSSRDGYSFRPAETRGDDTHPGEDRFMLEAITAEEAADVKAATISFPKVRLLLFGVIVLTYFRTTCSRRRRAAISREIFGSLSFIIWG